MFYKKLKTKRKSNGEFENPENLTLKNYYNKSKHIEGKFSKFELIQISALIAYICELEPEYIYCAYDWGKDTIEFNRKAISGPLKNLGPSTSAYSFRDVIPYKNGIYIIENEKDRNIINRSLKIKKLLKK